MKRERLWIFTLIFGVLLCGCGFLPEVQSQDSDGIPSRMVQRLDIAIHPGDEDMSRGYTDMEKMSPILRLLRDMDTTQKPDTEPSLTGGQSYYTITATYASGESRVYYLLGHQYLRVGEGDWCQISSEDAMELIQYIRDTPDTAEPAATISQPDTGTESTTVDG